MASDSANKRRTVVVNGRSTSVKIEDPFWTEIKEAAAVRGVTVADLVTEIANGAQYKNLARALRCFVIARLQARIAELEEKPLLTVASDGTIRRVTELARSLGTSLA